MRAGEPPLPPTPTPADAGLTALSALRAAERAVALAGGDLDALGAGTTDQTRKLTFLKSGPEKDIYNPHALQTPASPYQLMAGTVIAASLVTGLNSDLPGFVIAQVTENVFDTVSGRHLLIPQGARLVGKYDNIVAFGQERALVVWQRKDREGAPDFRISLGTTEIGAACDRAMAGSAAARALVHLSPAPKAANDRATRFPTYEGETSMDQALRDKGIANRKAVLGEDYVNKAMASADDFNRPFQDILNEYCWGMIWSDDRLPRKTRSMLNLVMLACLNRMHEWELHLKGALRNGVTKDEIQAIIHQIAIYAGVPLAVECFRAARKVFAEVEKGS